MTTHKEKIKLMISENKMRCGAERKRQPCTQALFTLS